MITFLLAIPLVLLSMLSTGGLRNHPPVAVNDEVMVTGYTDYLEIPVFANDYDPEGQPIDVIALGKVDRGKAELLEGDAVAITPDYGLAFNHTSTKPALIAHGTYIISDGLLTSTGEWYVWYQRAKPAD